MQLTVGTIVEGKVSKITNFGAFIDIDGGGSGMVHISEIANAFVKDINEHLTVGQTVRAKVVAINENNKIALSIKALLPVEPKPQDRPPRRNFDGSRQDNGAHKFGNRGNNTYVYTPKNNNPPSTGDSFEDMMNRFKKTSDDKLSDLSRVIDTRRGSNNRRSREK